MPNIFHHAHNYAPRTLRLPDVDFLSDRVLARPGSFGKRAVHQHHGPGIGMILGGNPAASEHRDLHRIQVAGRDGKPLGR
jgi:hypothetical protein